MYQSIWPGAYSFKNEIQLFVQWLKKQVDELLLKIENTEKTIS